jgi:hypothetical protein
MLVTHDPQRIWLWLLPRALPTHLCGLKMPRAAPTIRGEAISTKNVTGTSCGVAFHTSSTGIGLKVASIYLRSVGASGVGEASVFMRGPRSGCSHADPWRTIIPPVVLTETRRGLTFGLFSEILH